MVNTGNMLIHSSFFHSFNRVKSIKSCLNFTLYGKNRGCNYASNGRSRLKGAFKVISGKFIFMEEGRTRDFS